jgi:hypothetical protein
LSALWVTGLVDLASILTLMNLNINNSPQSRASLRPVSVNMVDNSSVSNRLCSLHCVYRTLDRTNGQGAVLLLSTAPCRWWILSRKLGSLLLW